MKQLREQFEPIRDGLARGESYLLMYRSRPLATLLPYDQTADMPTMPVVQSTTSNATTATTSQTEASVSGSKTSPQLQKFGLKKMLSP